MRKEPSGLTKVKLKTTLLPILSTSPVDQQIYVLQKLLRKAEFTAFGKYYGFEEILRSADPVQAFQSQVPIFDYSAMLKEWWYRLLEQEANVTWPEKVKYFALSSGTTDAASKYIPVTKASIKSNQRIMRRVFFNLTRYGLPLSHYSKSIMILGGSTQLQDLGGIFAGDLSGINLTQYPFWIQNSYKPGLEISRIGDWQEKLRVIVQKAAEWPNIGSITGIPAWNQLLLEQIIDHYKVDTIHDVWPELSLFVHGGVSFEPYRKSFEKLCAKPLTYIDTYLASEGFIAYQYWPDRTDMKLVTDVATFFEFVPFNDDHFDAEGHLKPGARALSLSEVEAGTDYALLMSNCAGVWRYLIGDTIRFTNVEQCELQITGRTKHFLSICGEHLSVDNMVHAVKAAADDLNVDVREFTVGGIPHQNLFAHQWYIGCDQPVDETVFRERLDYHLKRLNDDYRTERTSALQMFVQIIPTAMFYNWQEKTGKFGGQHKFPRVMKAAGFRDWEAFVQSTMERNNKV